MGRQPPAHRFGIKSDLDPLAEAWVLSCHPDGASYLPDGTPMTYGDVFLENEREFSAYNFEVANVEMMRQKFDDYEAECHSCLERKLPLPAYDCVMKCSHAFNLLDARGALSAVERANYILRVRAVAKACCESYLAEVAGKKDTYSTKGEVA